MRKSTGSYPSLNVDTTAKRVVSHAGAVLLSATARRVGLYHELSAALRPWMRPLAIHDPGKVLLDLAMAVAIGGDCLADIAQVRAEPALFGHVASDPTVSRPIWALAGQDSPDHTSSVSAPLVVDLDATLITAHSEKELAAPTFKRGFGHHPIGAWVDHGDGGTGEPVAMILRKGNAGSNTAVDHIDVTKAALSQLPSTTQGRRPGRKVLIRTDGAGGTHDFLVWLTGQRLQYSVGFSLNDTAVTKLALIPQSAWTPAYDADNKPRDGAWVTELTGLLDLSGWPDGMRVIVRAERPHPGAQLRFTDSDGNRLTAFITNTTRGQLADLELRHRRRARCEDRIRNMKDTGLRNLPLHDFSQNQIWIAVVMLATELTAWMQMLALAGEDARVWEPKRLRLRLFSIAGSIAHHSRRTWLHVAAHAPHVDLVTTGLTRLQGLPQAA